MLGKKLFFKKIIIKFYNFVFLRVFLALCEEIDNRGKIVAAGGGKV